mmetsp:Transcript_9647/g.17915  ORF Transcript_9647/g.17915 Transcript_9647/m.17915 type:complete len:83 (-) Transcript_9647:134-382(-)
MHSTGLALKDGCAAASFRVRPASVLFDVKTLSYHLGDSHQSSAWLQRVAPEVISNPLLSVGLVTKDNGFELHLVKYGESAPV